MNYYGGNSKATWALKLITGCHPEPVFLRSRHSVSICQIQVRTLTRSLQLDHCPAAELKCTSAWGHEQTTGHDPPGFCQQTAEFRALPGPEAAKHPQTITHHMTVVLKCSPLCLIELLCYLNLLDDVKQVGHTCWTLRNQEGANTDAQEVTLRF